VLVTNSHAATYEASPQYYNVPQDIKCNNPMMAISWYPIGRHLLVVSVVTSVATTTPTWEPCQINRRLQSRQLYSSIQLQLQLESNCNMANNKKVHLFSKSRRLHPSNQYKLQSVAERKSTGSKVMSTSTSWLQRLADNNNNQTNNINQNCVFSSCRRREWATSVNF
jgi:hypothetical protein